jgi:hypothetical protein
MDGLVGADLVKAVAVQNPTSNIAIILDMVNEIMNKRIVKGLKLSTFDTAFHLLEAVQKENTTEVLGLVAEDTDFPEGLRVDIQKLLDTGLVNSFCKYIKPVKKCGCWGF